MTNPPGGERFQLPPLATTWRGRQSWRLLVTRFEPGLHFLKTWQAWRNDPQRPRHLHYVGLSHTPPSFDGLLAQASTHPQLMLLAKELAPRWHELRSGFHRFTLERGHLLLTLCVGELIPTLKEQSFRADDVFLDTSPCPAAAPDWSRWTAKALARCCRRGTGLTVAGDVTSVRTDLTQCGFEFQTPASDDPDTHHSSLLHGQFNPRWALRAQEVASNARAAQPGTCAVVGSGLAGASVAAALARRGWQVQVFDQANEPAAGASGLPVGLVVPHVSVDDCPLSRLSRAGVSLMLHEARALLQEGEDWAPSGTLERCFDGDSPLSDLWHPQAAWLKPGQLVRAWLAQPGIVFRGASQVTALRPTGTQWELLDEQGQGLACADRVVLANACGVSQLLTALQTSHPCVATQTHHLPTLHGLRGQVSWAWHEHVPGAAFPPHPVNGAGSVIPGIPWVGGKAWFVGATYQPQEQLESADDVNHAANRARVQRLLPALDQFLAPAFTHGQVNAWKHTRCVTADRLPVVGPVDETGHPGLWICAGMGSRGLSFSVLCAELLAAQWGGEPWVIEARLARLLTALRSTHPASGPMGPA